MMRRKLLAGMAASVVTFSIFVTGAHAQSGTGNSDAVHLCQKGGYENVIGTGGTTFSNVGECISFVGRSGPHEDLAGKVSVQDFSFS